MLFEFKYNGEEKDSKQTKILMKIQTLLRIWNLDEKFASSKIWDFYLLLEKPKRNLWTIKCQDRTMDFASFGIHPGSQYWYKYIFVL